MVCQSLSRRSFCSLMKLENSQSRKQRSYRKSGQTWIVAYNSQVRSDQTFNQDERTAVQPGFEESSQSLTSVPMDPPMISVETAQVKVQLDGRIHPFLLCRFTGFGFSARGAWFVCFSPCFVILFKMFVGSGFVSLTGRHGSQKLFAWTAATLLMGRLHSC